MLTYLKNLKWFFLFTPFLSLQVFTDNFNYNSFNNHGVVGLINMPSARMFDEGVIGVTIYDGTPDQKITITSSPYDWLEASFFSVSYTHLTLPTSFEV